jgi:hypothetical protein
LHSCYGHIEDVRVTFWKCSDIFSKNFTGTVTTVVELSQFSNMFGVQNSCLFVRLF